MATLTTVFAVIGALGVFCTSVGPVLPEGKLKAGFLLMGSDIAKLLKLVSK